MLDSKNINTIISAHVSVSVDEIEKAVVDMTAAGVDPGTADRQMASFRQLFIGFSLLSLFHLTPSHYIRYDAVLLAAFSIKNLL